jgi:hypothetical protein
MYKLIIPFSTICALFLCSCTENRIETPEFFSSKTGIKLCKNAVVKNQKISDYDYSTDFIYAVRITASKKCIDTFYNSVRQVFLVNCYNIRICQFMSEKSWSYNIVRVNEKEIIFRLDAI